MRSHQGVQLTPAGRSLYEDAQTIIRLSREALEKARRIGSASQSTVRIGTSLLFKCRLFPDIWSQVSRRCPHLRVEICPLLEHSPHKGFFPSLGVRFDLVEGIYASTAWEGLCQFLELERTPICCALSPRHPLAGARQLTMKDLEGAQLVMPVPGLSRELDQFREQIALQCPSARILDSPYYGLDTFTLCEVNPYILITQQVYQDIHSNLVTIPLDTPYTLPYGLMYANAPSPATQAFLQALTGAPEEIS